MVNRVKCSGDRRSTFVPDGTYLNAAKILKGESPFFFFFFPKMHILEKNSNEDSETTIAWIYMGSKYDIYEIIIFLKK